MHVYLYKATETETMFLTQIASLESRSFLWGLKIHSPGSLTLVSITWRCLSNQSLKGLLQLPSVCPHLCSLQALLTGGAIIPSYQRHLARDHSTQAHVKMWTLIVKIWGFWKYSYYQPLHITWFRYIQIRYTQVLLVPHKESIQETFALSLRVKPSSLQVCK